MLREGLLLAAAFSAIVLGSITAFGVNSYVITLVIYLYFFLPVTLYFIQSDMSLKRLSQLKSGLLVIVDEEEKRVKNLISGEEIKIHDYEKLD